MFWIIAFVSFIAILGLATFIDRKVSRKTSVVLKTLSLVFTILLVFISLFLYGEDLIQTLLTRGNFTSDGSVDKFLGFKIMAVAAALLVWVFVLVRSLRATLSASLDKATVHESHATSKTSVVSEIEEIPNIVVLSDEIFKNKEGLEEQNLVFSFAKKEVNLA